MATMNVYETLYNNMKEKFTVVNNNAEYTLGEYMSMKANKKTDAALPAVRNESQSHAISAIFTYVNDKLTVKKPPMRDKVIKRFPFRTSAAAFLSALVACTLMFSYGIFALNSTFTTSTVDSDENITEEIEENSDSFEA